MAFDFGILQPFVNDAMITDIDSNGKTVYTTHVHKGKSRAALFGAWLSGAAAEQTLQFRRNQ